MEKSITIISGASRGIGRAIAQKLAKTGHFVILLARNREELEDLELEIDESGGKALAIPCDVSDEKSVNEAVAEVVKNFGRIDAVIANAGLGAFGNAENLTAADFDQMMNVNVKGTFLLAKAAAPHMKKAQKGHFVAIASDVSKRTFAGGSLYCASKFAQDAFIQSLRREVRKDGIKVSGIFPGLVDTFFHGRSEGDERQNAYLSPRDIAEAVAYVVNAPAHVVVDELMIHPISQDW